MDGPAFVRVLPSLLRALDAARETDISDSSGFGMWDAPADAPYGTWHEALLAVALDLPTNVTHGWRPLLEASSTLGLRALETAYAAVQRLLPLCPEVRHVVHSDLLNFNVLVDGDEVSAVIDWGSSLYGDFLWDVAWLTFWQQPWYPEWNGIDIVGLALEHYGAIGLEVPNFTERLRCYELCIGLDGLAYQSWKQRWHHVEATSERLLALAATV